MTNKPRFPSPVVDRLCEATNSATDQQLADFLSVARVNISVWRSRGTTPLEACIKVALAKGVTLDYLILGHREYQPSASTGDADKGRERMGRFFTKESKAALGRFLVKLRGDRTQLEMAQLVGTSRSAWTNYESGRRLPSAQVVAHVAAICNVPSDEIYAAVLKSDAGAVSEIAQDYCAKDHGRIDAVLFDECWHVARDLSQSIECSRDLALRTYNARVTADDLTASLSIHQIAAVIHAADRERSGQQKGRERD